MSELQVLPTKNPAEVAFRIAMQATQVRPNIVPAQYTAFKNTRLSTAGAIMDGFGDYVFGMTATDGQMFYFYFVKNKTPWVSQILGWSEGVPNEA